MKAQASHGDRPFMYLLMNSSKEHLNHFAANEALGT